jgi:serine/threonine protein kinase
MAIGSMILADGTMLAGYRVSDVIGMGGMSIVYRAEQVSLGREVALKVLSPDLSDDRAFRERFRREGRSIAALEHPNIVPIFDSGDAEGRLFLAMRLVRGESLADRMRANDVSAERTIAILRPIAAALDAVHQAGIIHRDIKPQNILISSSGDPYLTDFGIAKGATAAGFTATGGFVGSFNYAAPEQILGHEVTQAVDVYALAAVLYQCLTGEVPYPRDTDAGVLHAHVNAPLPEIPSEQRGAEVFNAVIARGMAKSPEARIGSTRQLIALAAEVISSLPPEMRRRSPTFKTTPASATAAKTDRPPATDRERSPMLETEASYSTDPPTAPSRQNVSPDGRASRQQFAVVPLVPTPTIGRAREAQPQILEQAPSLDAPALAEETGEPMSGALSATIRVAAPSLHSSVTVA